MTLLARAAFAASLYDVAAREPLATKLGDHEAFAFGDAVVVLASSRSAAALVREAPPLDELPDVITPWMRARAWATEHRSAAVAPVLAFEAIASLVASAKTRGLSLANPDAASAFVVEGSLARAFVFTARRAKLRLDRVQNAIVRANGPRVGEAGAGLEGAALAALTDEPVAFKELLRRARTAAGVSSDDGRRLASALLRAWERSDVELQNPMK